MNQNVVIVAIALKILAVYLGINALFHLLAQMQMYSTMDVGAEDRLLPLTLIGVEVLIALILVTVLWRFPFKLARKLVPAHLPETGTFAESSIAELQSACLSVVGLVMIAWGLKEVVYWITLYYSNDYYVELYQVDEITPLLSSQYASLGRLVAVIVLGVYLSLGARGVLGLIRRIQETGLSGKR